MATKEKNLWNWLSGSRRILKANLQLNRVENSVAAGMPDVEGCYCYGHHGDSGQFWIELKCAGRPIKSSSCVRFAVRDRDAQVSWLDKRYDLDKSSFILLQVGSHHDKSIYLIPGKYAFWVYEGQSEYSLSRLSILPSTKCTSSEVIIAAASHK